jgi:integrase
MGTICAKTGLRISEVLGLKWGDIDATTGQAGVLRSVVDGAVGRCKTETSQQPVPLDELTLGELQSWREVTMYAADSDWVFASLREDAGPGRFRLCRRCYSLLRFSLCIAPIFTPRSIRAIEKA